MSGSGFASIWEIAGLDQVTRLEKAILESCSRPRGMSAERGGRGIPSAVKALEAL